MRCIYTPAQLEEISDLYRRIALVTTRYEFTTPLEQADLDHVRHELIAALPGDHRVTLRSVPGKQLCVDVSIYRANGLRYYQCLMIVREAT